MPKFGSGGGPLTCSFCGKAQDQVVKLIAGPGVYICDECVALCVDIIEHETGERFSKHPPTDSHIEAAASQVNDAVNRLRRLALRRRAEPEGPPAS